MKIIGPWMNQVDMMNSDIHTLDYVTKGFTVLMHQIPPLHRVSDVRCEHGENGDFRFVSDVVPDKRARK